MDQEKFWLEVCRREVWWAVLVERFAALFCGGVSLTVVRALVIFVGKKLIKIHINIELKSTYGINTS